MAEYEADRDLVKERVTREKIAREAKEAAAAAKAAQKQAEGEQEPAGEVGRDGSEEGDYRPLSHPDGEEDEDESYDDGQYGDVRRQGTRSWGAGNKLGGP